MIRVCYSGEPNIPKSAMLIAINNQNIEDILEYRFYNDLTKTRHLVFEHKGKKTELVFEPNKEIPIELEYPVYKHCENDCDFCFIKGLPNGMRKELYFRDDDYRLSFMFGNFLSLTNINKEDIKRIARLRLSPLYISVHTTDPELRKNLFKHKKAELIKEQLWSLVNNNIKLHCQIVVIPGINDGENLVSTITDLAELYPGIVSIGIVPVGRTKYSDTIPALSQTYMKKIIKKVTDLYRIFKKKYHCGLVYIADEFFIKTGTDIPPVDYYDDFPQYENGIGMARSFLNDIASLNTKRKIRGRYLFMTGVLATPIVNELKVRLQKLGCITDNIIICPVSNEFFGPSVTVSGLLSAQDFSTALSKVSTKYDKIILPPNCINDSKQFIDNQYLEEDRVIIAPNNMKDLLSCLQ